jgi:hypothetical protein
MGELAKPEQVTNDDELALLRAFRLCDREHHDNALQFVIASSRRSIPSNVVRLDEYKSKSL